MFSWVFLSSDFEQGLYLEVRQVVKVSGFLVVAN